MRRPKHNTLKIMDIEDIKIGEIYYTPAKVIGIGQNGNTFVRVLNHDIFCSPKGLRPIPSEPPTLVGPAPKHDPCRLFRKGDKVRVVEWNGRDIARVGQIGYVVSDERNSKVELAIDGWTKDVYYPACHLELVTPVEELEPYIVSNDDIEYCVFDRTRKMAVCRYDICHPNAKAAAEAECARLNAEHRKEQQ